MTSECCAGIGATLIFKRVGAAHCGQVANRAAIELRKQRKGPILCPTAAAAEIPDKLERTRNASFRVAIEGCKGRCAQKRLKMAGRPSDAHVELAAIGIEKRPAPSYRRRRVAVNRMLELLDAHAGRRERH